MMTESFAITCDNIKYKFASGYIQSIRYKCMSPHTILVPYVVIRYPFDIVQCDNSLQQLYDQYIEAPATDSFVELLLYGSHENKNIYEDIDLSEFI